MDNKGAHELRDDLMVAERKGRKKVERLSQSLERIDIEYVDIDSVKPNPWNPNRQSEHDFELLLRSIEEDGFTDPVKVVQLKESHFEEDELVRSCGYLSPGDVMIVDGEHRWRARRKLGFTDVPVAYLPSDWKVAQMRIATLRHNRARGSEDIELAADVLRDLDKLGALAWAQDSLMLDDVELQRLLDDVAAPEALAGEEPSQAWEPDSSVDPEGEPLSVEARVGEAASGDWAKAATPQAVERARERQERLAEAKTEEQRQMIRQDTKKDFYRLSLVFAGDEAVLVKDVLGGAPAEALIELCAEKAGVERALKDEGWVTIDSIIGQRMIPAGAAAVLKEAVDRLRADGTITDKNAFQVVEYLAAEFLAS